MKLNRNSELVDIITTAAEDNNFTCSFDYSGRCMYGKTCFGIVGSLSNIGGFFIDLTTNILAIQEDNEDDSNMNELCGDLLNAFSSLSMDSMGLDSIIYFTRLKITENEEKENV